MNPSHGASFVFRRYAGSLQLRLRTFEDLLQLSQVPEALWVATACPASGLTCDPAFLTHLDTAGHGRVRARQLHRAIEWTARMLADRSACVPGSDVLVLAHLSEEAAPLRATAETVLTACEAVDRSRVTLAQVRQVLGPLTPPPVVSGGVPGAPPVPYPAPMAPFPPVPGMPGAPLPPLPPAGAAVPPFPFPQSPGVPAAPFPPAPPYPGAAAPFPALPPLPSSPQFPLPPSPPPAPVSEEHRQLLELERLILFQRWLFLFANNFVAMPDLYEVERRALYEQGTLILAGREFSLAVLVTDRASHAALAAQSSMFILYCRITGGQPPRAFEVAVPVTSGTTRGLFVGKRGIFRDIEGHEYDAQVVQVLQQPVSLYEAAVAPFRRVTRFVTSRIEAWSMASEQDFEARLAQQAEPVLRPGAAAFPSSAGAPLPPPATPAPATPPVLTGTAGLLVGASVAVAALGSAFAFIVHQLRAVTLLQLLFGILVLCVAAMLPAVLLAFIRIYNRDLAVVLEGAGWAMNDRLRLTRRLGRLFTRRPSRPRGSRIDTRDQVEKALRRLVEKEEGRGRALLLRLLRLLAIIVVAVLLWRFHAEIAAWVRQVLTTRPPAPE